MTSSKILLFTTFLAFANAMPQPDAVSALESPSTHNTFDSGSRFEDSPEKCKTVFQKYPNADCILFDNEDCEIDDVSKPLTISKDTRVIINESSKWADEIESVSVRKGCTLNVWTGMDNCTSSISYRHILIYRYYR